MVGFFYVRKLIESRKLSRDFADRQISATSHAAKGRHVNLMNRRRDPGEFFQMGVPTKARIKIEDLANQLIHSYVFYLSFEEDDSLRGILVASDRIRNTELLAITLKDIIRIFEIAAKGEDDKALTIRYDAKRRDHVVRHSKNQTVLE